MEEAPLQRQQSNQQELARHREGLSYADLQNIKSGELQPVLEKIRKRRRLLPWVALAFSCFLTLITLASNFFAPSVGLAGGSAILVLISFLPMCFFFTGAALSDLQRENEDLRNRLEELHRSSSAVPA